jgi:hypothetical protein
MIAFLALAAALQGAAIDWDGLAPLPYRSEPVVTGDMVALVQREALAGNCPLPRGNTLAIEVAVLVDAGGGIRTTVPRGAQCPAVEQYAAALVAGFARNNLVPRSSTGAQWYRTSVTFTWPK